MFPMILQVEANNASSLYLLCVFEHTECLFLRVIWQSMTKSITEHSSSQSALWHVINLVADIFLPAGARRDFEPKLCCSCMRLLLVVDITAVWSAPRWLRPQTPSDSSHAWPLPRQRLVALMYNGTGTCCASVLVSFFTSRFLVYGRSSSAASAASLDLHVNSVCH